MLFELVAKEIGKKAVAIILTGMGSYGARGLLAMREAGTLTFAQDQSTSVVWGMPGKAVSIGAVDKVIPLGKNAPMLVRTESRDEAL